MQHVALRCCMLHFEFMPAAYLEGIRLFNAGHYWHAHEEWEACWLESEGDEALFFKAIIQAAAALVKWRQGNLRGLQLNWAKSRARLVSLPDQAHGLDLAALRATMDRLVAGEPVAPPILALSPAATSVRPRLLPDPK
jgi:predicted metal-dependent hydrolase